MPPTGRADEIADRLRARILAGELAPGARLPTRLDLQVESGGGSTAVQAALDALVDEGFIAARGRLGTFVVDPPPHLARVALVIGGRGDDAQVNRFWQALRRAAECRAGRGDERVTVHDLGDADDAARLLRHARVGAVAGILHHAPPPADGSGWSALAVPQAAVVRPGAVWPGGAVVLDEVALIDLALAGFAARGRRRVAVLLHGAIDAAGADAIAARVAARGLSTRTPWIHGCDVAETARRWLARWIGLLMDPAPPDRPDALLIADDHLIEPVAAGLAAAGIRAPDELLIAAHANFPEPAPCALPALRIGYDAEAVLAAGIGLLRRIRAGAARGSRVVVHPRADG